jgi:hypothetical protein
VSQVSLAQREDSAWWTVTAKPKMLTLLRKGRLALVAANILGKETRGWGFVAGVVKNGRWIPVLQKYGKDGPEVAMQRQSVSVSPEFGLIEPVIPVNQRPSFGPILNVGAALTLAHHEGKTPPATSLPIREWDAIHSVVDTRTTGLLPVQQLDVRHVDCISCHRVNAYAFTALDIPSIVPMWAEELARIPSLAKTDLGTPFLAHEVIKNTNSWNTRAFGHHHELPSVSLRTLTESLEAAQHGNEILGRTSRVWKQCDVKAAWKCLLEAKPHCVSTHCIPLAP